MSRFKAGDLALIIRDEDPYNLGKQVELIEFVKHGHTYKLPISDIPVVNISGMPVWVCAGDVVGETTIMGVKGFCQKAEGNIMPIKGDFAPVKEKEEELA